MNLQTFYIYCGYSWLSYTFRVRECLLYWSLSVSEPRERLVTCPGWPLPFTLTIDGWQKMVKVLLPQPSSGWNCSFFCSGLFARCENINWKPHKSTYSVWLQWTTLCYYVPKHCYHSVNPELQRNQSWSFKTLYYINYFSRLYLCYVTPTSAQL